jgi:orotidine-5'-phosphate decarboxylase
MEDILKPSEKIIVALDRPTLTQAEELLKALAGEISYFKIGKELFTAAGPESVRLVKKYGGKVFLDLKFHDIPNTVAGAVKSAVSLGVEMLNFHSSGGLKMMQAAVEAAKESDTHPILLGVTVLTSIDEKTLRNELRVEHTPAEQVLHLARLCKQAGVNGVVSSAREIKVIRENLGQDFKIVTPGIRPEWARTGDQKRVMTPREAIDAGADYLVIGRPITAAENPAEAARKIIDEIS